MGQNRAKPVRGPKMAKMGGPGAPILLVSIWEIAFSVPINPLLKDGRKTPIFDPPCTQNRHFWGSGGPFRQRLIYNLHKQVSYNYIIINNYIIIFIQRYKDIFIHINMAQNRPSLGTPKKGSKRPKSPKSEGPQKGPKKPQIYPTFNPFPHFS